MQLLRRCPHALHICDVAPICRGVAKVQSVHLWQGPCGRGVPATYTVDGAAGCLLARPRARLGAGEAWLPVLAASCRSNLVICNPPPSSLHTTHLPSGDAFRQGRARLITRPAAYCQCLQLPQKTPTSQQLAGLGDVGRDDGGQRQQVLLDGIRHACKGKAAFEVTITHAWT